MNLGMPQRRSLTIPDIRTERHRDAATGIDRQNQRGIGVDQGFDQLIMPEFTGASLKRLSAPTWIAPSASGRLNMAFTPN